MTTAYIAGYLAKTAGNVNPGGHAATYGAIQAAETGPSYTEDSARVQDFKEPKRFIRNKGTGNAKTSSSAYGPVQIGSMLGDYTRKTNPNFYKGLNERQAAYLDKLQLQKKQMIRYGGADMVPGMEKFDYGREGIAGNSPQERMTYHQVLSKIMRDVQSKKGGTVEGLKKGWKGSKMSDSSSSGWNKKFKNHMKHLGF